MCPIYWKWFFSEAHLGRYMMEVTNIWSLYVVPFIAFLLTGKKIFVPHCILYSAQIGFSEFKWMVHFISFHTVHSRMESMPIPAAAQGLCIGKLVLNVTRAWLHNSGWWNFVIRVITTFLTVLILDSFRLTLQC